MNIPIYVAGKTLRVQKNVMLDWVYIGSTPLLQWIDIQCSRHPGYVYQGIFADPACTIRLTSSTVVNKPLHIYPKLTKQFQRGGLIP